METYRKKLIDAVPPLGTINRQSAQKEFFHAASTNVDLEWLHSRSTNLELFVIERKESH